jgi:hypothetical protein
LPESVFERATSLAETLDKHLYRMSPERTRDASECNSAIPGMLGQEAIKVVGECLLITLTIHAWTSAHLYAARSNGVHEIPHIEFRPNVLPSVHFAARTQGVTAFFDDLGGEGNVTRDDKVSGAESFDYLVVRNVETSRYLQRTDVF